MTKPKPTRDDQRSVYDLKMISLTTISEDEEYLNGRLTLTDVPSGIFSDFKYPFRLLVWKIDDPVWKVFTTSRDRISENDVDWQPGVCSFTQQGHSWSFGMEVALGNKQECEYIERLRDRIISLTKEFGLDIEYSEYYVEGIECDEQSPSTAGTLP